MSSASAGSTSQNSGEKNYAETAGKECPTCGRNAAFSATSAVSAEAEQGNGPAAASASSSAVSESAVQTSAVSVCVGTEYAAAACDFGAVVVGPNSAAAVGKTGAVAVGPTGIQTTGRASAGLAGDTGDVPAEEVKKASGAAERLTP